MNFPVIKEIVFRDEKTVQLAQRDAIDGAVGTLKELAEKHQGRIVYETYPRTLAFNVDAKRPLASRFPRA